MLGQAKDCGNFQNYLAQFLLRKSTEVGNDERPQAMVKPGKIA
jgi:hypothetical protein